MSVEAIGLTKDFGTRRAVNDLSFTLEPGVVTGFLGPNGSGKSTTMRLMLGLDHGGGKTLFEGKRLIDSHPVTNTVGAHLDARFFNPNRTARNHLRMLASEANIPDSRVDAVLAQVGLAEVATKRPKSYSLGMAQRLGLAGAILAEPKVLLLDEPANGLDPQSIQWLRDFLQHYAAQGNIVFVSSHLLSEMQLMAHRLVVISRGSLIAEEDMASFVNRSTRNDVLVRSPERDRLAQILRKASIESSVEGLDGLSVHGVDTDRVGQLAFNNQVLIYELASRQASLEQAFLEMTSAGQEFAASALPPPPAPIRPPLPRGQPGGGPQ